MLWISLRGRIFLRRTGIHFAGKCSKGWPCYITVHGGRLFSTLVLIVAYVTLLSPIAFVMIAASFDYGQRAYVVFPPDRFNARVLLGASRRATGLAVDQLCASRFLCMLISCAIGIPCRDRHRPLQPARQGGTACSFPGTDADPGGGLRCRFPESLLPDRAALRRAVGRQLCRDGDSRTCSRQPPTSSARWWSVLQALQPMTSRRRRWCWAPAAGVRSAK